MKNIFDFVYGVRYERLGLDYEAMSQPKTQASDLIDRLNDLIRRDERSDFVLKQIRRDADRLKKIDAATSYLLLGMVACLERNIAATREFHEKALRLRDDFVTNSNYATSLYKIGAITEATGYRERAVKLEPENITALEKLIDNAVAICRFRYAQRLIDKWKSLNPNKQYDKEEMINNFVTVMNERKISDEEAESFIKLASTHMLTSGAFLSFGKSGCELDVLEEDADRWIDYCFMVDRGVDDVVEMNCELANLVAQNVDPNILKSIVVRYSAAQD